MIADLEEFKRGYIKEAESKGYERKDVETAFSLGFPFDNEWYKKEGKISDENYFLYECIYGLDKKSAAMNLRILKEKNIPLEEYAEPYDTIY